MHPRSAFVNTGVYGEMADDRLGAHDWVNAGLKALAKSGITALKADTLAKAIGVTRGSFYWHFADVDAFHAAILQRWRELALDRVVADIEQLSEGRLDTLIARAFSAPTSLEIAIRAWATAEPKARAATEAVDVERVKYLRQLLIDAGVQTGTATSRAHIINWTYLGYALSPGRLPARTRQHVMIELSRLGLSPSAG